jgi:hypothetical protein
MSYMATYFGPHFVSTSRMLLGLYNCYRGIKLSSKGKTTKIRAPTYYVHAMVPAAQRGHTARKHRKGRKFNEKEEERERVPQRRGHHKEYEFVFVTFA